MILKATVLLIALFALQRVWQLSPGFGIHSKGYIHRPGPCRTVKPIQTGSEDITLTDNGIAFISSGLRLNLCKQLFDKKIQQFTGRIYKFNFNDPGHAAVEVALPRELEKDFNPHGVSHWKDASSDELWLFVVNHRKDNDNVEVMKYNHELNSLSLVRSVQSTMFTSVNDILAVGPNSFYASNDGYFHGCLRPLEVVVGLALGSVVFLDGVTASLVVQRQSDLNSMALSKDGTRLFLTKTFEQQINIFNISKENGNLMFDRAIDVGVSIDNIYADPVSDDLWLGAHSSMFLLSQHMTNLDVKAPSKVVRVHPLGLETDRFESYELHSPFGDDGRLISGSSSAVYYQEKMLVGSISDTLVFCDIIV